MPVTTLPPGRSRGIVPGNHGTGQRGAGPERCRIPPLRIQPRPDPKKAESIRAGQAHNKVVRSSALFQRRRSSSPSGVVRHECSSEAVDARIVLILLGTGGCAGGSGSPASTSAPPPGPFRDQPSRAPRRHHHDQGLRLRQPAHSGRRRGGHCHQHGYRCPHCHGRRRPSVRCRRQRRRRHRHLHRADKARILRLSLHVPSGHAWDAGSQMSVQSHPGRSVRVHGTGMTLRILTAVALFIDAGVHIHLAPGYQAGNPAGIGQGNLFLLESAAAVLAGLYVLLRGSRAAYRRRIRRRAERLRRRGGVPLRGSFPRSGLFRPCMSPSGSSRSQSAPWPKAPEPCWQPSVSSGPDGGRTGRRAQSKH